VYFESLSALEKWVKTPSRRTNSTGANPPYSSGACGAQTPRRPAGVDLEWTLMGRPAWRRGIEAVDLLGEETAGRVIVVGEVAASREDGAEN
jgi:hypothetical protein